MAYREYKPTCVETLFSKPNTKFKAQVIIPDTKNLNNNIWQCKCGFNGKLNDPRPKITKMKNKNICHDISSSEYSYQCVQCCKVCKKHKLERKTREISNGRMSNRKFKENFPNGRIKEINQKSLNECCCNPCRELANAQNYPEMGRVMKHKAVQKCKYSPQRTCSLCEEEERGTSTFCSICQVWESHVEFQPATGSYSSRNYEDIDNELIYEETEDLENREEYFTPASRFIIESCKVCGRRQEGEERNPERKHDSEKQQITTEQSSKIFGKGRKMEKRPGRKGFYIALQTSHQSQQLGEEAMADDNNEKKETATEDQIPIGSTCNLCNEEGLTNENFKGMAYDKKKSLNSSSNFKRAYSSSEVANLKKGYKDFNKEHFEEYKEQLYHELTDPQKTQFRSCYCEYANKTGEGKQIKNLEVDITEIKMLRKKCDEALSEVDNCKKEIARSKQEKCNCNYESTMMVVEDCKGRCAELERQVIRLQQTLNYYAHNKDVTREEESNKRESRRLRWDTESANQRQKDESPAERRKWRPTGTIRTNYVSPRLKSSAKREDVNPNRRITCHHINCFPPEQLPGIASFSNCPGYPHFGRK